MSLSVLILLSLASRPCICLYPICGNNAPVIIAPVASAPIFVDARAGKCRDGRRRHSGNRTIGSQCTRSNTVRFLYPTAATTIAQCLLRVGKCRAPDILLRNISAEGSMAGIVNVDGAQSPFFILAVTSYGDTFSGMLTWEPTMSSDLGDFSRRTPAIATSTSRQQQ